MLVRVVSQSFVAGIELENGVCRKAAPILKWCVGKSDVELRRAFLRRGWKASIVATEAGRAALTEVGATEEGGGP